MKITKNDLLEMIEEYGFVDIEKLKSKVSDQKKFRKLVARLVESGRVLRAGDILVDPGRPDLIPKESLTRGKVVKLNETNGFVRPVEGDGDIFIPGYALKGAMVGDTVAVFITSPGRSGRSSEGMIVDIIEEKQIITGKVEPMGRKVYFSPDSAPFLSIPVINPGQFTLRKGDIVQASVKGRGDRHSTLAASITRAIGEVKDSKTAIEAILRENRIPEGFSTEVIEEAEAAVRKLDMKKELETRRDLRDLAIFTIDSSSTKDMDDAIYVRKDGDGYLLLVSIADVSHFVKRDSLRDAEAFKRGNSIYFGDSVVPMLPEIYSNDLCSLNRGDDKLTFTCEVAFGREGEIVDYRFYKSVIRSRLKGVYSEINRMFDGTADRSMQEKYAEVHEVLTDARELYGKLKEIHRKRGSMTIVSSEPLFDFDSEHRAIRAYPHPHGESEDLIEEFMLAANNCAAMFLRKNDLPGIYRVHSSPDAEKIDKLKNLLSYYELMINTRSGRTLQQEMSRVLDQTRGTDIEIPVHRMVLRAQSKAKYSSTPSGHFGLVMDDYSHFTSPIRRYSDLAIHRIMSDFLSGASREDVVNAYSTFAYDRAVQASERENVALTVERAADAVYKAEIMSSHLGESFEGTITSVMDFGIFVTLPDTIEGMVPEYFLDLVMPDVVEGYSIRCPLTGREYKVGDRLTVTVADVDIASGKITFRT